MPWFLDNGIKPLKLVIFFISTGHDIKTAAQLKEAIDSYGGIKGCLAAVCELDHSKQNSDPIKWPGISQINNFEYKNDAGSVRVWRAFNVGDGKIISKREIAGMGTPQKQTGMKILNAFLQPRVTSGALKKPIQPTTANAAEEITIPDENDEYNCFTCPEEGCVKAYQKAHNLQRHLDFGKHEFKLHQETQYDSIRRQWAEKCTSIKGRNPSCPGTLSGSVQGSHLQRGWALVKSKKRKRFSKAIKEFLLELFMIGEETGRKITPSEASHRMRSLSNQKGERVFSKDEWLTAQQIASYFSRLSTLKKGGQLPSPADINLPEEDIAPVIATLQRYNLRSRVTRELTL